jgi:hypothetical protein
VTVIVRVCPPESVFAIDDTLKPTDGVTLASLSTMALPLVFVIVTCCGSLVAPTATLPEIDRRRRRGNATTATARRSTLLAAGPLRARLDVNAPEARLRFARRVRPALLVAST